MTKKTAFCIILLLLATITVLLISCQKNENAISGKEGIIKATDAIVRSYGKYDNYTQFVSKEDLSWLERYNHMGNSIVSHMGSDDLVMDIHFSAKDFRARNYPYEIYAIFECWLVLMETDEYLNFPAITCGYGYGGLFDYDSWTIIVTRDEFEHFYKRVDDKKKPQSDIAYEMSELWIDERHYNRAGLKFDEEDEYRDRLSTQWKKSLRSTDDKFQLYNGIDSLTVEAVDYNAGIEKELMKNIEENYFYCAWDEKNNIWAYGENSGLLLYRYNGENDWTLSEITHEDEIPYPFFAWETH